MAEFTLKLLKTGGQAGKYQIHIDGELFPLPLTLEEANELMEKYDLQPEELDGGKNCPTVCPGRCVWCHITCRGYKSFRKSRDELLKEKAKLYGRDGFGADMVRRYKDDKRRTRPSAKISRSL